MFRSFVVLLLSYVAAAPLTDKISMDLSKTEWDNLWTYVIWLFSFGIWFGIVVLLFIALAGVVAIFDR